VVTETIFQQPADMGDRCKQIFSAPFAFCFKPAPRFE
jgi:hypothetical protein